MCMKYINTQEDQTVSIIPRKTILPDLVGYELFCQIKDETTKQVYTIKIDTINFVSNYFEVIITGMDFLKENTFYEITFSDNVNEIVYKDRMYCTNQNVNDFSINDNQFILPNIDNNYYITI